LDFWEDNLVGAGDDFCVRVAGVSDGVFYCAAGEEMADVLAGADYDSVLHELGDSDLWVGVGVFDVAGAVVSQRDGGLCGDDQ